MPRFDPQPERRPAVVTGASSGIGAETARVLARAGHPVVLGARRVEVCDAVADEIRAAGGEAAALHVDLADPASIEHFAAEAERAFGPAEVLVSNAARIEPGSALETEPADFEDVLRVNVGGAHRLVRAFGAGMVAPSGRAGAWPAIPPSCAPKASRSPSPTRWLPRAAHT